MPIKILSLFCFFFSFNSYIGFKNTLDAQHIMILYIKIYKIYKIYARKTESRKRFIPHPSITISYSYNYVYGIRYMSKCDIKHVTF